MEIRFSDTWARGNAYPEDTVKRAAKSACLHAHLKWADDSACRFILVEHPGSYHIADHASHDKVICALLAIDPLAEIRTAKAIYCGLADFERQNQCAQQ